MRPIRLFIYIGFLGLFAILSCKREDKGVAPKPRFEEYFPLQPGAWRIYQVDSLGKPTPHNDTVSDSYQLKEVVDSAFIDGAGNRMYKVLRYKRKTDHDAWALHGVFATGINGNEAIQQEGNFRYVKLIFPVQEGRVWNANVYNNEDSAGFFQSRYTAVHKPATIDSNTFDSTAFVELNNEEIAIYKDYKIERYAAGVGLIDFQHDSVTTQAQSFWFRKRIVSFGR